MTNKPLLGPRKTKDDKKLHWEGSSEHLRKALDLSKIVTRRFQLVALAAVSYTHLDVYKRQCQRDVYFGKRRTVRNCQ